MNELRFSIVHGTPAVTTVLAHSPDGWDENFIEIQRSEDFHGFMTSFIPKLKFVKDGATLLRTIFYNGVPNYVRAYLTIDKLDKTLLTYSQIFYGELKFDTFIDDRDFVEITVAEGELSQILKKNLDTDFDCSSFLDNMTKLIYHDEDLIAVDGSILVFHVPTLNPANLGGIYTDAGIFNGSYYYVNDNNQYVLFRYGPSIYSEYWAIIAGVTPTNILPADYFICVTGIYGTYMASGAYVGTATMPNFVSLFDFNKFIAYNNITDFVEKFFDIITSNGLGFGYDVSGITIPSSASGNYIKAGEYNGTNYYTYNNQYILFFSNTLKPNKWIITSGITPDELAINYFYSTGGTPTSTPYTAVGTWAGTLVVAAATNPYDIDATFFNTYNDDIVITQGFYLRTQLSVYDKPDCSLSLKNLYKALKYLSSCAMTIELIGNIETLIFREISDLYLNTATDEIENIGEVADDFRISLWDKAVNSIKIGFPNKTYTVANNTFETNTENIYVIGNKIFTKEMDLLSSFRGDGTGIADILLGNSSDSDFFFISIISVDILGYTDVFRLKDDTVRKISNNNSLARRRNITISPERCLDINKDYICSFIYGINNDRLVLTIPKKINEKENNDYKNVIDCETSIDSDVTWLKEREGILISSGTKFLLPFIFEFTGQVSENFTANFKANPNGFITFAFKGETYKGFILKAKYKPTGKEKCTFTLISTPDNDLKKLIR